MRWNYFAHHLHQHRIAPRIDMDLAIDMNGTKSQRSLHLKLTKYEVPDHAGDDQQDQKYNRQGLPVPGLFGFGPPSLVIGLFPLPGSRWQFRL